MNTTSLFKKIFFRQRQGNRFLFACDWMAGCHPKRHGCRVWSKQTKNDSPGVAWKRTTIFLLLTLFCAQSFAAKQVLNVYAWTGEVPDFVVRNFEKETGIKVNFSTYENNEIMYAKIRASKTAGYDVIMPSSYFVERMARQNLIIKLDKSKIPNFKNVDPAFSNPTYDRNAEHSMPYIWGITGIFYNKSEFQPGTIKSWSDLWDPKFDNKLMLLDDSREVFSMALISLGYSANDHDPEHIKQAFLKLKSLMKNVKVFSTDTVVSILIDEDATVGMAWNGDAFKASRENPNVNFVFPKEGFVFWVDNFSIPVNAPHKEAAYQFLNYILRADVAKDIALSTSFPTTNLAGRNLLPETIRNNPVVYPTKEIMQHGQFQTDLGDDTLALFEKYWEELKMSG